MALDDFPEVSSDPEDSFIVKWYSTSSYSLERVAHGYTAASCQREAIKTMRQNAVRLMEEAKRCLEAAEWLENGGQEVLIE